MVSHRQVLRALIILTVLVICWQVAVYDGAGDDHHGADGNSAVADRTRRKDRDEQRQDQRNENHDHHDNSDAAAVDGNDEDTTDGIQPQPRIHFITVQTSVNPGWCRNMRSAIRSGITVSSLGWGQAYKHTYRPKWIMRYLREALPEMKMMMMKTPQQKKTNDNLEDDVVLFSDGADTMFTGVDPQTILDRYEQLAREYGKRDFVLYSAEANCFHQQLFDGPWGVKKGRCIAAYKRFDPSIHTKWRYLNAGTWIGTVRAALWLFGNVSRVLDADRSLWCDQSVIGGMMLRGPAASDHARRLIMLDTKNTIFLPTYHLRVKTDVCPGGASDAVFSHPEQLVLCHGRRAPAVLHFNGKSGSSGTEAEKRVTFDRRYASSSSLKHKRLLFWDTKKGSSVTQKAFQDVCPKFV